MIAPNNELSEDLLKQSLIDARGDLFIAATSLKISPLRMQRLIQTSPALGVALEVCQTNAGNGLQAAVDSAIANRLSLYRVVGLDSLAELATMPIDENSAQNQVRFAAASRLAGETASSTGGGELAETLRSLNDAYQTNAPRIKVTRERLTVEMQGDITDIPIEHQPASSDGQTSI